METHFYSNRLETDGKRRHGANEHSYTMALKINNVTLIVYPDSG